MRQIKALEQRFATVPIQAVYSSDLIRTQLTAGAIYLPKNLPLHLDPGLREIHMGDWEDRTWGEVRHKEPQQLALFNHSDPTFALPTARPWESWESGSIPPCGPSPRPSR